MGCGKSHISKLLSDKLNLKLIDLDREIIAHQNMPIAEIFAKKGEIFFRKQERAILDEILNSETDCILSVGGGTPAYYDNISLINEKSTSVYLRTSVKTLTQRLLKQKQKRPLIANVPDEQLPEFIGQHLFERQQFYSQAQHTVITDHKTPEEICREIAQIF
jgi:shikimate kinase